MNYDMPKRMRRLLHCGLNFLPDTGHARRQTSRNSLYTAFTGFALRHLRSSGPPSRMLFLAGGAGDVREQPRGGDGISGAAGARYFSA
ncbi:hypothetical protein [Paenibacillus pasadenensis]|uniref:hypothetical protein n=1 Tax=Paenibacillus pasadenensis TaxID=217090 RepID=UPI00333FCD40